MKPVAAKDGTVYTLDGPQDAPTIILIHGLGLTYRLWQWHSSEIANRYRVLCYDLYGHGGSPLPARPDLSLFSRQLRNLMDELNLGRAALVGFSLGGMINRRYALDYPERVQALVILNSPHERGSEAQKQVEQRAIDSAVEGPSVNLDTTMNRWFTHDFQSQNPDLIQEIRSWILANNTNSYALCRQVLAFGVTELVRPKIPLDCPTLVMTAEFDQGSTPAMAKAIATEIQRSELHVVKGLKHMALVESPEAFTQPLLKFLEHAL